MKTFLAFVCSATITAALIHAQAPRVAKPYKVVFDLTSDDPHDQTAVVRWVREVAESNPQNEMEVVMYGRGLALVMPDKSSQLAEVKAAMALPHVAFKVCEIAMKNQHVSRSQLLPAVGTVPDGIAEIVGKQTQGWGYIKAIH